VTVTVAVYGPTGALVAGPVTATSGSGGGYSAAIPSTPTTPESLTVVATAGPASGSATVTSTAPVSVPSLTTLNSQFSATTGPLTAGAGYLEGSFQNASSAPVSGWVVEEVFAGSSTSGTPVAFQATQVQIAGNGSVDTAMLVPPNLPAGTYTAEFLLWANLSGTPQPLAPAQTLTFSVQ